MDPDKIDSIIKGIGELKTGGLIVVALIVVVALVAWLFWLRQKRLEAKLARQGAAAAEKLAAAEQAEKSQLSERTINAFEAMSKQIAGLRTDMATTQLRVEKTTAETAAKLEKSVTAAATRMEAASKEQTSQFTALVKQLDEANVKRHGEIHYYLREIVDRTRGVISIDDSLRIVEQNFHYELKPNIAHVVTASVRGNHYFEAPSDVEERFLIRANKIIFDCHETLAAYAMRIDVESFFAHDDAKHYELADMIWEVVRGVHEVKADLTDKAVVEARVQLATMRVEDAVNSHYNRTRAAILSLDSDFGIRDNPRKGDSRDGLRPNRKPPQPPQQPPA